ncbi:MAG: thiolase family protein [Dehalococcoidia bacterium]|nr:thiolase family protein [Dehalococcoidia bacterium]
MPRKVAIVGIGQTKHEESKGHYVYYESSFEAAKRALEDAALDRGDLDTVIASGWDAIDGRTISDMHTCMAIGGYLKDSSHVAEDGIMALVYGYVRIASGLVDIALVAGHGHREASIEAVTRIVFDPLFTRPAGRNYIVTMAMQANAYMHKYGVDEEQAAKVVVKNRANGVRNPYAHLRSPVALEEVLASRPVAYPLKALDCPPESVGAVALILAGEETVRRITDKPVWIRGIGWAIESYEMGAKDLAEIPSLAAAAQRAYQMAGIRRPLDEFDLAEVHEATSFHELMDYEALGFAEAGQGAKLIDEGTTEMAGKLPVNPSGGSLCTNLFGGSGLVRAAEAALQLRGEAHGRQVAGAKLALAHGLSAPAGAAAPTNCVAILERG